MAFQGWLNPLGLPRLGMLLPPPFPDFPGYPCPGPLKGLPSGRSSNWTLPENPRVTSRTPNFETFAVSQPHSATLGELPAKDVTHPALKERLFQEASRPLAQTFTSYKTLGKFPNFSVPQ